MQLEATPLRRAHRQMRLLLLLFAGAVSACNPPPAADETFVAALNGMEREIDGRIGVYALQSGGGPALGHRANERFAMASTFKLLLGAAVLAEVDAGRLSLDNTYTVDGMEIQPYSPVVGKLQADESIDLASLAKASVSISDNSATNMLLELVGGPAGLTNFLREHGDTVTRLDRYEVELNTNLRGDKRDTTTPRAMAESIERLLLGDALSEPSTRLLQDWLVASSTGLNRLRAGLPTDWRVGDKTGYGANGAVNDVAIAWPPQGSAIIIAVFMSDTQKDVDMLNSVHARIAAMASEWLQR